MAFLIEFHDRYAIKALNTDFKNETQVDSLQNDPLYLDFSTAKEC